MRPGILPQALVGACSIKSPIGKAVQVRSAAVIREVVSPTNRRGVDGRSVDHQVVVGWPVYSCMCIQ